MSVGIGVIGAGTVGGGVVHALLHNGRVITERSGLEVRLVHVADLNTEALAEFDLTGVTVSQSADDLIHDPAVDIVCELIGGVEPAKTFILKALNAKKHVVTANKMLIAKHGPELNEAAVSNGVDLRFEAAVAGGIPIIKALREGLIANRVDHVYGILNGTCNYILTRMTLENLDFEPTLQVAQSLGFAETPPDLDVEGHDTAHKAQIIASLCFATDVNLDGIHVEGITSITHDDVIEAREMGYVIKLLAIIQDCGDEIDVRVHPTLVPEDHLLASVRYEFNAVYVQTDICDATSYYGRGAGRFPTASAVVADICDIARRWEATPPPPFIYGPTKPLRPVDRIRSRYYIRLTTEDKPGVLGTVTTSLGRHDVGIASCLQKEQRNADGVHILLMTYETEEAALRKALAAIEASGVTREAPHVLRVL